MRENQYVIVRRWRGRRASVSAHQVDCPGVKRKDVAFYLSASSILAAELQAMKDLAGELGRTSHWTECKRCV